MEESSTTHHWPLEDVKTGLGISPRKAKIAFSIDGIHKAKVKKELGRKNSEPSGIGKPINRKSIEQVKTKVYTQLSEYRLSLLLHRVSNRIRHLQRTYERRRKRRRICRRIVRILNNMCEERLSLNHDDTK